MNKDVIYIEPENDITDIIAKIENSKEKIVALVPPKKAGVFRSVVNIKLIAKAGITAEKTVVLVTIDPSVIKLAAATKIPVTKDLQTAPSVPKVDIEINEESEEELTEEPGDTTKVEEETKEDQKTPESGSDTKEEVVKPEKKRGKVTGKAGNVAIEWIKSHKKTIIFSGIGLVVLIILAVWAFGIAPAATVTVGIKTENSNFSENVTFTTNAAEENAVEGKFYLQEKKIESVQEVTFEATGKKNVGEKATGEVVVYAYFKEKGVVAINAGSIFTINDLSFVSDNEVSIYWDGKDDVCDNKGQTSSLVRSGCQVSGRVPVTAASAGTSYNIAASNSGWKTTANIGVYSDKAMSGGTDNIITVVEQADIEKAKSELKSSNESENKAKLLDTIDESLLVIDGSFSQDTSAAIATPAVGEEVKEGVKPTLKATTTDSIFVIDKAKVEEFIREKAKLGSDQKIYKIKDPYVESFVKADNSYTGRLKTSYAVGPKVTENDIVEMIKGKGIGDAQHDLKNITGVVSVSIDTSYPWVNSIPIDTNKITVNLELKDN